MTQVMDIRAFYSALARGKRAFVSGAAYEQLVRDQLHQLTYKGVSVRVSDAAGANKTAHDLTLLGLGLTLEVKRERANEGGGCTMRLQDGVFRPPENSVLRSFLPPDLQLWGGRVPACLRGDRSSETWLAEKDQFPGVYVPVPSAAVADYYRAKGTMYMLVEGKGLYHTGEDPFGFGVPKFEPPCRIRIRLKQHSSTAVPQDVQACFNFNSRVLPPSPCDFMDPTRLPPGFARAAE